ncbi:hypothetical protein I3760_16G002400 [Carya illinoinensis]|nr:hypothetical protein I3760_16G002400 [Carya illinoinensis]
MIARLGLLVAASIAAFAVRQLNVKTSRSSTSEVRLSENGEANFEPHQCEERGEEQDVYSYDRVKENDGKKEEEEEEVKLISSVFNRIQGNPIDIYDEEILPEFEELLSGEIEYPFPGKTINDAERDKVYEIEMANNASELERMRKLVNELEEREVKLEGELLEYYGLKEQESDILELQRQLKIKTVEIDMLNITINSLQTERKKLQEEIARGTSAKKELEVARNKIKELQRQIQLEANQTKGQLLLLKQQVSGLQAKEVAAVKKDSEIEKKLKAVEELEIEVVELKRKNKELQHEKRELTVKLDAAEARIAVLSNMTESERVAKAREEVNNLRHANEDLLKQVEGLQMNRFGEVEELVYLRWVNACLRYELRNHQAPAGKTSARDLNKSLSPKSQEKAKQLMLEYAGSERGQGDTDLESNVSHPSSPGSEDFDGMSIDSSSSRYSSLLKKPTLIQKLKKWGKSKDDSSALSPTSRSLSGGSPSRRPRGPLESLMLRNAGDSMAITTFGRMELEPNSPETPTLPRLRTRVSSSDSLNTVAASFHLMSKSVEGVVEEKYPAYKDRPPPPPGSLPRGGGSGDKVHRAPELVEFYQSLMKREAKKDTPSLFSSTPNASDARSNMIGEIENRSSFLLAVKADVETQGDFVMSLATEVRAASFTNIEDLLAFVNWLDEELSFLVDERAVLKHFDWPEGKADALREAAFEYQDLMKLEKRVSAFVDDPKLPCEDALKKMYSLLEKMETSVYALLRTRDMAISRYREFGIPVDWLLDSGVVGKIKLSSVQLARKYMKRVASELDALSGPEKEPNREFLVLQGVRFAFRVHQFAGGFDAESMKAFEELRSRIHTQVGEDNKQDT